MTSFMTVTPPYYNHVYRIPSTCQLGALYIVPVDLILVLPS